MKRLPFYLMALLAFVLFSCSESTEESNEYENWTERNEVYFASLTDSLNNNPAQWRRIKSVYLDQNTEGKKTDYIYVKMLPSDGGFADETEMPLHTDSVRIMYQGRNIQGKVFDGTVYGDYSSSTNATAKLRVSTCVDGMATALQHMHRGDHWIVYIPETLGYGSQDMTATGLPPYSVLIFEMTLVDFCRVGESLPVWSSREKR